MTDVSAVVGGREVVVYRREIRLVQYRYECRSKLFSFKKSCLNKSISNLISQSVSYFTVPPRDLINSNL